MSNINNVNSAASQSYSNYNTNNSPSANKVDGETIANGVNEKKVDSVEALPEHITAGGVTYDQSIGKQTEQSRGYQSATNGEKQVDIFLMNL